MSNYRKIYEQHHGKIPKDKDGRSYEVHHIDGNRKNDSPENLIAVTIQEHYNIHYKQGDWAACLRISGKIKLSPEEISELATKNNIRRVIEGTNPFVGPEVNLRKVANGTHPFLGGDIARKTSRRRVTDGSHHLLGPANNRKRIESGEHNFLGPENFRKMLENGTHSSQKKKICEYCNREFAINTYTRWHGNNCKLRRSKMKRIIEIRQAEGGEDSALFTKDLSAAYQKLFTRLG